MQTYKTDVLLDIMDSSMNRYLEDSWKCRPVIWEYEHTRKQRFGTCANKKLSMLNVCKNNEHQEDITQFSNRTFLNAFERTMLKKESTEARL
jgi:hypothetical protein